MKRFWLGLTLLAFVLGGIGCGKKETTPVANEPLESEFSVEEEIGVPTQVGEEAETPTGEAVEEPELE